MRLLAGFALLTLLTLAGCRPSTPVVIENGEETPTNGNGEEVKPPKHNIGNVGEEHLPANPARDVSEEQKQVDAMEVAALVEALDDEKLGLVAVDELKTRGAEAVEPLAAALDNENEDVRQRAILALGMLGADAKNALPKLKAIAADDDQSEIITSTAANAVDAIEGN